MEKMQKLNLRMQKLNFPGTHWRGLAVIGAQKKTLQGFDMSSNVQIQLPGRICRPDLTITDDF